MLPLFPRKRNSVTVQAATQVKREKKLNAATRCFETASRCRLSFRTQGRKRRISQLHPKRNLTNKLFFFFSLPKKNRPIFLAAPSFFASLPPTSPRGKVPAFSLCNMGRDEEPPPPRTHQPSASTPVLGAPPRPAPPPPRPPTSVHPQPHPQPPPLPPCSLIVAALQSTPPPPPPLSTSGVSRPPPPHITGEET